MIVTTTPTIEGHTIKEYKGLVSGEVIFGMNFLKDIGASLRDHDLHLRHRRSHRLIKKGPGASSR